MDKQRWLRSLRASDRGATAVEYGLIASLIVIAALAGIGAFAGATIGLWDTVGEKVTKV